MDPPKVDIQNFNYKFQNYQKSNSKVKKARYI